MSTTKKPTKVLLVTLHEHGQSNTILAMAAEFLSRESMEVHISSFSQLESRVPKMQAEGNFAPGSSVQFHAITGVDYTEACAALGVTESSLRHVPATKDFAILRTISNFMTAWDGPQYLEIMHGVTELVNRIDADVLIVDLVFAPALEACRNLGRRHIVNSPTQAQDLISLQQPGLRGFWKYPALCSGLSYPIPTWKDTFLNVWVMLYLIKCLIVSPRASAHRAMRKEAGFKGRPVMEDLYRAELDYITPSIVETDLPLVWSPSNVRLCGPITLATAPVAQADPELHAWLSTPNTRTIIITLGTHIPYSEGFARAFVEGLIAGLPGDMQVLWKLSAKPEVWKMVEGLLTERGITGKVRERWRIVHWLEANPSSIIEHKNVACYVHHGGANSFLEACLAGIPQIVLPQWVDTYSSAAKVEFNGYGIYGNKTCAPEVDPVEFGTALARILGNHEEGKRFKVRAVEVAGLCKQAGGRKTAVDFALECASKGKLMEPLS